jgi:hypothetical protein
VELADELGRLVAFAADVQALDRATGLGSDGFSHPTDRPGGGELVVSPEEGDRWSGHA